MLIALKHFLQVKYGKECCSVLAAPCTCTIPPCMVVKSSGMLRPQHTSPIGGLHTPNMEVTTRTHFPHWRSTHTKYGSYDHNTLPPLEVYTHQIWKLRPQHTSPIGGLHKTNMEEGMTNNAHITYPLLVRNAYIAFISVL